MKALFLFRILRVALILLVVSGGLWVVSRFVPYARYPMKVTFASALISGFIGGSISLISFAGRYMALKGKPFPLTLAVVAALSVLAIYLFIQIPFGELYEYHDPYRE